MITLKEYITNAAKELAEVSDSARLDVELIILSIIKKPRTFLFTEPDFELNKKDLELISKLVKERSLGKPIAQILGAKEFWSLTFKVTPDTLIPRPDTECLVEAALEKLKNIPKPIIIDLGTGTGAIGIALAHERPDAIVHACDYSKKALAVAAENINTLKISNVELHHSNWLLNMPKLEADLIISNPPYIDRESPNVEQFVKAYEPSEALFSDHHGYKDLLTIIQQSKYYLRPKGFLIIEHGIEQEETLAAALQVNGYRGIEHIKDMSGRNRAILGQLGLFYTVRK